ncbi:MAG: ornithine carbamoyltransferase, partial [Actinomycetota bacterium]|nr:ornithine carbamoyltransferase [Actinomycetota bacterium]
MTKRDFLSVADLSSDEISAVLDRAAKFKKKPRQPNVLEGKQVALIFEKPSTRTRVSFEAGVTSLGGHAIVLRGDELQLGRGETIEDTGRVLSRYVDAIVIRTFGQDRLDRLSRGASVPVINALSDLEHPCQALADLMTIEESKGRLDGIALGYLGDGNNVANSLLLAGARLGMDVRVASPQGYEPDSRIASDAATIAAQTGGRTSVTNVVAEAAVGADVLYTDVWASMGQEEQSAARAKVMERYRLDSDVVRMAADDCIVMHCLPAHRGEEIAADVIDSSRSVVWDQAE